MGGTEQNAATRFTITESQVETLKSSTSITHSNPVEIPSTSLRLHRVGVGEWIDVAGSSIIDLDIYQAVFNIGHDPRSAVEQRICYRKKPRPRGFQGQARRSAKQFLPFIREKFPKLARQYEQFYSRNVYPPEEYRRKIAERVAKIRVKHGFHMRPFEELQRRVQSPQLSLAWNTAA